MAGFILLEGGAEFGGRMAEPDQRAIELAGGPNSPIRIIPAAAVPDHNHQRAGMHGVAWFQSLGATDVAALPLIDRASANDPAIAGELRAARLIYLLGGFTHYLGQTLTESTSWQATLDAYADGAVIAGSSAGAMVLCETYYNPASGQVFAGLGLVSNTCVLPHHNAFGKSWGIRLTALLPTTTLLGIDEHTGLLDDGNTGTQRGWQVYGAGSVTTYRNGHPTEYRTGSLLRLE